MLPAFIDGWLDAAPPTVQIVEGDEDAYRFNDQAAFDRAFVQLKLQAPRFVSPENRTKLRLQYSVGHGIYLDAHVNPPSSPWYIDRRGGTSAERLTANVTAALAASDGYVWIYGETGRWWSGGDKRNGTWPEKLPGADLALRRAKNPLDVARETLASPDCGPNLLKNGSLSEAGADQMPAHWWTWQDERSHGNLDHQQGVAHFANVANGVFGQNVAVKPGETYIVRTVRAIYSVSVLPVNIELESNLPDSHDDKLRLQSSRPPAYLWHATRLHSRQLVFSRSPSGHLCRL